MIVRDSGGAVLPRRDVLRIAGGSALAWLMGCVGYTYGDPFRPPITVARGEEGMLYSAIKRRYDVDWVRRTKGPLVYAVGGVEGNFEFLVNGGDPLNDYELGVHELRVRAGDEIQMMYRQFEDDDQRRQTLRLPPYEPEFMSREDEWAMAALGG